MTDSSAAVSASVTYEDGVCRVSGVLDFTTANSTLRAVEKLIRSEPSLSIDLAGVSRCNSAGLALLIEWLAVARRENHVVTFSQIPDSLRQLAGVCQVDGLI